MPEFLNGISGLLGGLGGGSSGTAGASAIRVVADTKGVRSNIRGMVTGVNSDLGRLGEGVGRGLDDVGHRADEAARSVNHLARIAKIGLYTLATAVPIIGLASIKAAIDYETAFIGVRKTVDATEEQFAMLSRQFREMAKTTPGTAAEFAKLGEAAGALGISVENIREFVDVTSTIGDTTNVSADIAATSLGQLSNVLKLTSEDYKRFGSTLVDLGNKGASTEAQILEIAARSGAAGALIGMSAKDVLAFASSVASLGMEVEAGGTALQTFYLQINKLVGSGAVLDDLSRKTGLAEGALVTMAEATKGKSKDAFEALAKSMGKTGKELRALVLGAKGLKVVAETAGMSADAFKKFYEDDPTGALQRFIVGLGKQDQYGRQQTLRDIGMTDSRRIKMLLALSDNTKLLGNNIRWANDAWRDNTALMAEAEKRYASTSSQLTIMRNNFTDIAIEIGTGLLPMVVSAAKWLGEKVPAAARALGDIWDRVLAAPLQRLGTALGNLGEALAGVFSFADSGEGSGDGLVRVFESLATATGALATHLTSIVDVLAEIGRSPAGKVLGSLAVTLAAAALALKVARGAANTTRNVVGGTISSFTGLNPLAQTASARQQAQDVSTARILSSAIEAAALKAGSSIASAMLSVVGEITTNLVQAGSSVSVDMQSTATATAKTIQSGFNSIKTVVNQPVAGLKTAAQMLMSASVQLTRAAVVWKADVLAAIRQAGGVFFLRKANGQFLPEQESWDRLVRQGLTNPLTVGAGGMHVWQNGVGPVPAETPVIAARTPAPTSTAQRVRLGPVQGPPQYISLPDGTFRSVPPEHLTGAALRAAQAQAKAAAAAVGRAGIAAAEAAAPAAVAAGAAAGTAIVRNVVSGVDEAVRRPGPPDSTTTMKAAGGQVVDDTAAAVAAGAQEEAAKKPSRKQRLGSALAGAGSKLMTGFMALMFVDIVAALAAQPIGEAVIAGTGFKRAGQRIKEDFFGGLVDLLGSIMSGTDEWVGHAAVQRVGNATISSQTMAALFGTTSETLGQLEAPPGSIPNLQGSITGLGEAEAALLEQLALRNKALRDGVSQGEGLGVGDQRLTRQAWQTLDAAAKVAEVDGSKTWQDYRFPAGGVFDARAQERAIQLVGEGLEAKALALNEALDTAVGKALQAFGWNKSTFDVSLLSPEAKAGIAAMLGTEGGVNTYQQQFIDWVLAQEGQRKPLMSAADYRRAAHGDEEEAARLALQENIKTSELAAQAEALRQDRLAALQTYEGRGTQQWLAENGAAMEAMLAAGVPDAALLQRMSGIKTGGMTEAELVSLMGKQEAFYKNYVLPMSGSVGAKPFHDAVMAAVQQGFSDGLSLEEIQGTLGPFWHDLFNDPRGAGYVSDAIFGMFNDGIKGAAKVKGKGGQKEVLNLWNAFMPDEFDITGGTHKERWARLISVWMEQFRDAINSADTTPEQNALLKVINGMLPPGLSQFADWDELIGALRPAGKPEPGGAVPSTRPRGSRPLAEDFQQPVGRAGATGDWLDPTPVDPVQPVPHPAEGGPSKVPPGDPRVIYQTMLNRAIASVMTLREDQRTPLTVQAIADLNGVAYADLSSLVAGVDVTPGWLGGTPPERGPAPEQVVPKVPGDPRVVYQAMLANAIASVMRLGPMERTPLVVQALADLNGVSFEDLKHLVSGVDNTPSPMFGDPTERIPEPYVPPTPGDPRVIYQALLNNAIASVMQLGPMQRTPLAVQAIAEREGVAYGDLKHLVTTVDLNDPGPMFGKAPPLEPARPQGSRPVSEDILRTASRRTTGGIEIDGPASGGVAGTNALLGTPADLYGAAAYQMFMLAGKKAIEQVAAGIGSTDAQNAIALAMGLTAQQIMDYLPQSPVNTGPLQALPASGMKVVGQVAEGIRAAIWMLPVAFEQGLRVPDLSAWTGGILAQIRAAIVAANVLMQTGFVGVTSGGVGGAGSGGAADASRRMLGGGGEATQGGSSMPRLAQMPPPMPRISSAAQAPRFSAPMAAASSGGGGTNMPVYIDKMTVLGPEDESSIVRRLSFLSPTGR